MLLIVAWRVCCCGVCLGGKSFIEFKESIMDVEFDDIWYQLWSCLVLNPELGMNMLRWILACSVLYSLCIPLYYFAAPPLYWWLWYHVHTCHLRRCCRLFCGCFSVGMCGIVYFCTLLFYFTSGSCKKVYVRLLSVAMVLFLLLEIGSFLYFVFNALIRSLAAYIAPFFGTILIFFCRERIVWLFSRFAMLFFLWCTCWIF